MSHEILRLSEEVNQVRRKLRGVFASWLAACSPIRAMEISGQSLGRTPLYKRLIIDQIRRISTSFDMHHLYRQLYSRRNLYPPWSLPYGGSDWRQILRGNWCEFPASLCLCTRYALKSQRVNTCVRFDQCWSALQIPVPFGSHNHLEAHDLRVSRDLQMYLSQAGKLVKHCCKHSKLSPLQCSSNFLMF